jgi:ABC-type transport system substrate-binding protein
VLTSSSTSSRATWFTGRANPDYHVKNQPYFDTLEIKGGGDAVSAARAVLQTGEFDYAWNMQVEDAILKRLETGGAARSTSFPAGNIEFISSTRPIPDRGRWRALEHQDQASDAFYDPRCARR